MNFSTEQTSALTCQGDVDTCALKHQCSAKKQNSTPTPG